MRFLKMKRNVFIKVLATFVVFLSCIFLAVFLYNAALSQEDHVVIALGLDESSKKIVRPTISSYFVRSYYGIDNLGCDIHDYDDARGEWVFAENGALSYYSNIYLFSFDGTFDVIDRGLLREIVFSLVGRCELNENVSIGDMPIYPPLFPLALSLDRELVLHALENGADPDLKIHSELKSTHLLSLTDALQKTATVFFEDKDEKKEFQEIMKLMEGGCELGADLGESKEGCGSSM